MKRPPANLMRNTISVIALLAALLVGPAVQPASSSGHDNVLGRSETHQHKDARNDSVYPFVLHSGFWINLHHFLYEQATERKQPGSSGSATGAVTSLSQLNREQQQLWNAALDYYTKMMIKGDLLQDRDMATINDILSKSEAAPDLSNSGLKDDLRKVLEDIAPVYRARWWPQHDKANRFWIALAIPMVKQFGETFISQLTAAYKGKWPAAPIRVDVVEYANWAGGYTTVDPDNNVHTTICSIESGYQGFAALEMLFHEASHSIVSPRNGAVAQAIARECQAKNKPIPNGLWHAIIFYTVGEFTKRNLKEYAVSDYIPVGYRGLYARAWPNLQRPLELYWQPYLDGTVDFDKAISNLIGAL
jgi:hypothetical protein